MTSSTYIIEGLCTTRNEDGSVNIAPMGPIVDPELTSFRFRPFQSSTTFENLRRERCGVFHVTDDVLMIARAALGQLPTAPEMFPARNVDGNVIATACRWYEFEVVSIDDSQARTEIETRLVHTGRLRDYFGLNRARHAVLELAILATRRHLLPAEELEAEIQRCGQIVSKTAGPQEREAFQFLCQVLSAEN